MNNLSFAAVFLTSLIEKRDYVKVPTILAFYTFVGMTFCE